MGADQEAYGAVAAPASFRSRAAGAQVTVVDGAPGLVVRGADCPRPMLHLHIDVARRITEVAAGADGGGLSRVGVRDS